MLVEPRAVRPCDDARAVGDARRCVCVCVCLLIKGQTDSGGTDGRQLKGWKIVSIYTRARRAAGCRRGGRNEGANRPSPVATVVTSPGGVYLGSGGRLTPSPAAPPTVTGRGGGRLLLLNRQKPRPDVFEKFAEKLPTLSDSCARLLLMTLFRRPFDYDVFLTAAAAAAALHLSLS